MLDDDGLPLDEVGPWAKEKHAWLLKYVGITSATRLKWIRRSGCATYIDPFCATGRATIRGTGEKIDGSPLVAFKAATDSRALFSEIHIADASEQSCRTAEIRLRPIGAKPIVYFGKAEHTAREIVGCLNPVGLHLAFLDPYKLESLPFSVIATLAELKYIDLFIHVSVHDLQRNFDLYSKTIDGPLNRFAPGWRQTVSLKQAKSATRAAYVRYWASRVEALGFQPDRYELVSGVAKNQRLYWLLLVSRHPIANKFWDEIRNLSGQRELL